ncbi:uncharacterized protein LOC111885381 [Lactuca sativa]|uniref:Uncharacterized protein n=1 Tax=Lactuca sativa TaxID=4236 RepID=A0A9R1UGW6_LACSA|nr:uncharacterized protein LOC111885381 [Lactuca sativa]XP_023737415.1 uncharacterized protein LOC111885381 [Lactuca sativa]XP_023737416.1 uncharacterized protein LOC111885381 [Lactuca sativa]XP_052623887.1 uncharacterized protein LOC111885381 [Lactuca sativa]KAJ0186828.1 hypothetical protein LSAT_V11C900480840 [Lactuca sativa]
MDRRIDPDAPIDYVELQIFPSHNRYEACVSTSNIAEKVASGDLQQLLLHLPQVKDLSSKSSNSNFKILAPEDFNDHSWFTTATLKRFLQIVGSQDILTIGNEISQLEETRKFQLSLFAKAEVDMTSSFESKNELLRTVDLRLSELKENLSYALNQATGAKCSTNDISNMENLAHHFGAEDIRDSLQKLLELSELKDSITETSIPTSQLSPPVKYGVSPAKAAQIERQMSTDSETSFSSEDNQPPPIERSRTPARSAASRRSASPMRRIQIGRGGPRRPAVLSIKSLNYAKTTSQRDEAGQSSQEEDEESERVAKSNALRMSVQDKISLFESKQKEDQGVEIQKPKIVEKAVLRRWSSGMSESHGTSEIITKDPETEENMKSISPKKDADVAVDDKEQGSCEKDISTWNEQKEAELNQLFNKMMESKPVRRHSVTNDTSKGKKSSSKEQRGGFYDHYKQKRDEKLRKEVGKRAEKDAQFKEMQQFLDDKKAEIVSTKNKQPQKSKSPIPKKEAKKETPKASVVKKITNKPLSQLPATRKSWPSAPSPKPTTTSSTPTPTRKPQSATPAVRAIPITKAEKSKPQSKISKVTTTQPEAKKMTTKTIIEKKQTPVVKPKPRTKVETPVTPSTTAAKPSFYKKVTKKSSVVPVETKPFLRKGTGIGPGGGAVVVKSKAVAQIEEPITTEVEAPIEPEKIQVVETTTKCEEPECEFDDAKLELESEAMCEEVVETCDVSGVNKIEMVEVEAEAEVEVEEELMISPTAWVENNCEDEIVVCEERDVNVNVKVGSGSANVGVPGGVSSPRVRHSLFQMLLEETGESESGEWGNAQHPPVQKDAPKGFKRLLKFARKTKADLLLTDGSSPSSIFRRG